MAHRRSSSLHRYKKVAGVCFAVGLGLLLASCTSYSLPGSTDPWMSSAAADGFFVPARAFEAKRPKHMLVTLPDSGAVKSFDQKDYDNGFVQQVELDGRDTFTRLEVQVVTDPNVGGANILTISPPSEGGIASELSALSSANYQIIGRPIQNRYGPVGVAAFGRCIYAWQWIDDIRPYDFGFDHSSGAVEPLSLRIERCRKLPGSAYDLVAAVQKLGLGSGGHRARGGDRAAKRSTESDAPASDNHGAPAQPKPGQIPRPISNGGTSLGEPRFLTNSGAGAAGSVPAVPTPSANSNRPASSNGAAPLYQGPATPPGW